MLIWCIIRKWEILLHFRYKRLLDLTLKRKRVHRLYSMQQISRASTEMEEQCQKPKEISWINKGSRLQAPEVTTMKKQRRGENSILLPNQDSLIEIHTHQGHSMIQSQCTKVSIPLLASALRSEMRNRNWIEIQARETTKTSFWLSKLTKAGYQLDGPRGLCRRVKNRQDRDSTIFHPIFRMCLRLRVPKCSEINDEHIFKQ